MTILKQKYWLAEEFVDLPRVLVAVEKTMTCTVSDLEIIKYWLAVFAHAFCWNRLHVGSSYCADSWGWGLHWMFLGKGVMLDCDTLTLNQTKLKSCFSQLYFRLNAKKSNPIPDLLSYWNSISIVVSCFPCCALTICISIYVQLS